MSPRNVVSWGHVIALGKSLFPLTLYSQSSVSCIFRIKVKRAAQPQVYTSDPENMHMIFLSHFIVQK